MHAVIAPGGERIPCRSTHRRGRELPPQLREREQHFGRDILVTRKGAVSARRGDRGSSRGAWGRARLSFAAWQ